MFDRAKSDERYPARCAKGDEPARFFVGPFAFSLGVVWC
jgi:hypothetical protein